MSATYGKFRAALPEKEAALSFYTGDCWVQACDDLSQEGRLVNYLNTYVCEEYMDLAQAESIHSEWCKLIEGAL
jgi:hypothetical protein